MIVKNSFKDYRQVKALNMSSLVNIKKSPKHFKHCLDNPKESDSLDLGRAVHTLVLEPNLFDAEYAVSPKFDMRKTADKEAFAQFQETAKGKEIIDVKTFNEAKAVAASVLASPKIQNMLSKGQAEVSIEQTINDVSMKFRLDFLAENFLLDVKTTRDCTERSFQRDFIDYDYHIKLAAYQYAAELETGEKLPVIVLAVETKDELDYQIYQIDQDFLDIGRREFFKLLEKYKEAQKNDFVEALPKNVKCLCAPEWLIKKDAEENN